MPVINEDTRSRLVESFSFGRQSCMLVDFEKIAMVFSNALIGSL